MEGAGWHSGWGWAYWEVMALGMGFMAGFLTTLPTTDIRPPMVTGRLLMGMVGMVGYGGYGGYAPAYPPVVTVPSAPIVIQQQPQVVQGPPAASAPAPAANYWHYCRKPEGYYPYVKNCPGGWLQVVPQPIQ